MVLSYLRWESDATATFGLISSSTSNVLFQKQNGLALAGGGEAVLLFNVKQGTIIAAFTPDGDAYQGVGAQKRAQVTFLAGHPLDSALIAVGYSDGTIRIWNITERRSLVTLHGHRAAITCALFNINGSRLYTGSADTEVIGWDVVGEQGLFRLRGHKGPITSLAVLEQEGHHHLISSSKDTLVKVWDLDTQHCIQTLVGHRAEVTALTVNAAESQMVTGAAEGPLRVWNILTIDEMEKAAADSKKKVVVKSEPGAPSSATAASPSSSTSSSSSSSSSSTTPGSIELITFWGFLPRESTRRVCQIQYWPQRSLDPQLLIVQSSDRICELFGVRKKEEVDKKVKRRMKRQREKAKKHAANKDEKSTANGVASSSSAHDDTRMTDVEEPGQHSSSSSASTADGAAAALTAANSTQPIPIDQFHALIPIRTNVKIVSFATSSSAVHLRVLFGMADNSLQVWNVDLSGTRKEMEDDIALQPGAQTVSAHYTSLYNITSCGHRTGVRVVSLNSDSTSLLTASSEQIKVWNVHSRQCIRTIDSGYALCGFFVPGSRHVLIGTKSGELELYDLSTGSCLQKIAAHGVPGGAQCPVYTLDLRPDQKGFVSGGGDKEVKVWDFELVMIKEHEEAVPVRSLQIVLVKTLKLTDDVLAVKNSPDGKLLAVGLLDSTIKIFYADSLKFFLSLYGHKLPVLALDISSDSSLLVSGSADKNIKLWGLEFGDCHKSLFGHMDSITSVKFIRNTHLFVSTGKDKLIKLWDGDTFEQIQVLEGHTQEIWGAAINHAGTTIVSSGNDKSIRLYRQSESQLFLEEEREVALESQYDQGATIEAKPLGDMVGSGLVGPSESALVARTKANQESLKAGERLMEAVDMAEAERDRWNRYHEAVAAQQAGLNKSGIDPATGEKLTGIAAIAAEVADDESKKPIPVPPPNPLMRGEPDAHVLHSLLSIKTPELDESLLVLPFEYACKLMAFLNRNIESGIAVESCVHALLFLLSAHHKQLIANQTMLDTLRHSRQRVREQLQTMKQRIGFNIAAMKFIQRQEKETSGQFYFGQKDEGTKTKEPEMHIRKKRKY